MGNLAALAGILETLAIETGKEFNTESFASRLRIQKSIYLLKELGCPEVKDYQYSYYFRGPYCPSLAKDYYKLSSKRNSRIRVEIDQHLLDTVKTCVVKGDAFLESACTIHSISQSMPNESKEGVFETTRKLKPFLGSRTCDDAWRFLRTAGLL